ncbi:methionine--tRNA ligase [Promethearchaeum syntrophicum]|uniref:Methionine--tRNA ligase n=1 Tax=Promethearchaeum syntrophicum TaxID=2594042 RepID=A0A5B9DC15_9ARCH|nr:methionine--tRNA ligase [Candidatus Prometheoarchaeum syntrophicum]QEE16704.1 Methionine--tRNA ligase [Candidatus Prometheoarchaeum syntrophicum]
MVKKRKWVITSAWPYVSATPHLGNMIGSVLSGDVFTRYLRSKGDEVLYVSGSDTHGTPVMVAAIEEKTTPEKLAPKNHAIIKELFQKWLISYDNYTQTHNPTHIKFIQDFYRQVEKNGFVTSKEEEMFYCEYDKLFLPDRYIEGICPHCSSEFARGDQCDACGKLLEPEELINPHCKQCKKSPIKKKTRHWYLDFSKTEEEIHNFVVNNEHLPPNARSASLNFLKEGLPTRSITRDLDWGIPAPFDGAEGKTIYVWFEAVLGYISAVKEWAEKIKKDPKKFQYFWNDPKTRSVYFIGKDNIIFHLIIFPGLLIAYNKNLPKNEQFTMPFNVSSTEFLNYENNKFSKSRGVGIWIDDALELAPIEYWRYSLLRNRPEKQDSNFLWSQFEKDILELNDIIGNFIHRTLSFIHKNYDSKVPNAPPDEQIDEEDKKLIKTIKSSSKRVGDLFERFKIKDALNEIISISRKGNIYINNKAPWKMIKENKEKAGYTFYFAIQLVRTIGILLEPFIPNISEQILKNIGSSEKLSKGLWNSASKLKVPSNQTIPKPKPLFQKIDVKEIQKKLAKMHGKSEGNEKNLTEKEEIPEIDYEDFQKLKFRIGTIIEAELVPDTKNLIKLIVDTGETEKRTIVAGIGKNYSPDELIDTQVVVLTNLKPKIIKKIKSRGMILACDLKKKGAALLRPIDNVKNGTIIK